jgi:hypothetical protein
MYRTDAWQISQFGMYEVYVVEAFKSTRHHPVSGLHLVGIQPTVFTSNPFAWRALDDLPAFECDAK